MKNWLAFGLLALLLGLGDCYPVVVVEVAKEGLTTPKTTGISRHQGIPLTEYNDTLSEYGRQQQYLIGLEMRVRYNESVFNGECNPLDIFAYSLSKESVMLLVPPRGGAKLQVTEAPTTLQPDGTGPTWRHRRKYSMIRSLSKH